MIKGRIRVFEEEFLERCGADTMVHIELSTE